MSFPTPVNVVEELDVSKAVATSLDYAQAQPSQVNDYANWVPKTPEDWEIYERQRVAIGKAVASKNDPDLQSAIKSSIEEYEMEREKDEERQTDRLLECEDVKTEKGKCPILSSLDEKPERPSLEDRIHDLSLKVGSPLPILHDPQGDTHVYLDPPTQQPEQDEFIYAHYVERCKTPMLLKKQTLLSFNSSFFEPMFGSTYQFRILRRRGLVGNLPEHVKYVLDLTPPAEGDEAVYLMTELCCSEGIRKWFLATRRWGVSKSMIGGEDEYMPFVQSCNPLIANDTEYSPVRHRSAIERVLTAIHGLDPQLDSAPKVWTTFAVAKYFSLTHSPLTDYIVRWLRASPNCYFLEVNPEISLKIADGLQCHDLCRDVFAILVGEEALATTRRYNDPTFSTQASVYGRKREDLLESYQTRIEYASKAFIERVGAEFSFLVGRDMSWFESLPEFSKLALDGPLSIDGANELLAVRSTLNLYVRGALYNLLATDFKDMPDADHGLFRDDHLFPNKLWTSVWKSLLPRERILTRSFWESLRHSYGIFRGPTNLDIQSVWGDFLPITESTNVEEMFRKNGLMETIFLCTLEDMVAKLNYRSTFIFFKASDKSDGSHKSLWRTMQSKLGISLPKSLGPDASNTSSNVAADVNPESDSHDGEKQLFGFADGATPRISPDILSESLTVEYPFKDVFENASIENCLAFQQKPRFSSDFKHLNTAHESQQPRAPSPSMANEAYEKPLFELDKFFAEATKYVQDVATRMLDAPDSSMRTQSIELRLTNTLVSLTDAEWKFLPLWAGGNDDGSGGVFNDDIPLSHDGFATAGPKVRTGSGSTSSSSEDTLGVTSLDSFPHTSLQNNHACSGTKVASADGSRLSFGHGLSMLDDEDPTSDKSFVFVPSVSGSSVTFELDRTIMTPSKSEDEEGRKEKEANGLAAEMEVEESGSAEDAEGFDDPFELNDDSDSDTMDGEYDEEDDEEMDGFV